MRRPSASYLALTWATTSASAMPSASRQALIRVHPHSLVMAAAISAGGAPATSARARI
jgi:hypothetical protein